MTDIDEQIANAKKKLKRLKQRKAFNDLNRELKMATDSKDWYRGSIDNLIKDINQNKIKNLAQIKSRLQNILQGKQTRNK